MKKRIAIFVQHPKCSVQSANGVIKALTPYYDFKLFTKHEVEDDYFSDVDLVCFPGGVGDSDSFDILFKSNRSKIQDYIASGGRYLGICMGAYWAGHHYFGFTDIRTTQYIRRPNTCTRRYYSKTVDCNWNGSTEKFFFYDGPAFIGNETSYSTIARYSNGDPMAVIQGNIGLIGCHLESELYWYDKPYLLRNYHGGRHHRLLANFVDTLMRSK